MNIRILKLTSQETIIADVEVTPDGDVLLDHPCLIFAEHDATGKTKISYVLYAPFYKDQSSVPLNANCIMMGLDKEIDDDLRTRFEKMINPNKLIVPETPKIIL